MKSLKRRFVNFNERNPHYSTWTNFCLAVDRQFFGTQTLHRWFKNLVDKDDFSQDEQYALLCHLDKINKLAEECTAGDKFAI